MMSNVPPKRNPKSLGESDFLSFLASSGVILSHPKLSAPLNSLPADSIRLEDLLIDSFTLIEIAINLEEQYGVSISPDRLQAAQTLDGLFKLFRNSIDDRP
jgi:acyl carrier protein